MLLVAQVAMSLALLVMAGLFVRTLHRLQTTDVGFRTENLLLFEVGHPSAAPVQRPPLPVFAQFVDRVAALPGVRAIAYSGYPLLSGTLAMPYLSVPGRPKEPGEDRTVFYEGVSPGFFETMEMPIVRGGRSRRQTTATGRSSSSTRRWRGGISGSIAAATRSVSASA